MEHRIRDRRDDIAIRARYDADKPAQLDAGRGDDVIDVAQDGRAAIGRVGEPSQREVRGAQLPVDAEIDHLARVVLSARIELVDRARIGACPEVAGRARDDAVAAHLHVPEERLAEHDRRRAIAHVIA